MRGDSGVAGEGRVVGVPKFHSWDKCTMPLTNINSDWMSNTSSGLRIILLYYVGPVASWGVMRLDHTILADIITLERQEETVLGRE